MESQSKIESAKCRFESAFRTPTYRFELEVKILHVLRFYFVKSRLEEEGEWALVSVDNKVNGKRKEKKAFLHA